MKLSFAKKKEKGPTPVSKDVSDLFGGAVRVEPVKPIKISTFNDEVVVAKKEVKPVVATPLIYDPAAEGKEAWMRRMDAESDEDLAPIVTSKRVGESLLMKAAKNRKVEPETVNYHKCDMEDYGKLLIKRMGVDPDGPEVVPDVIVKIRPYAQAGLGANVKLPTEKGEKKG
eukprot:Blabericola_migrator_1__2971@NODE_1859_length_3646_cov_357_337804_g1189_i0_p3_GENE_NODE_1859_length_3646_cov_357_337804_g1189_i0NODE_1859_length_3646_cov_357_337804_g1189_i0_p3_ORF_typecomplete_len171_score39_17Gpatch_2/PF12656_7/0_0037_NODE_1859_length_3646_cov_357_337804_g1189_i011791691